MFQKTTGAYLKDGHRGDRLTAGWMESVTRGEPCFKRSICCQSVGLEKAQHRGEECWGGGASARTGEALNSDGGTGRKNRNVRRVKS